jgi:surfeit locus 1 family protein
MRTHLPIPFWATIFMLCGVGVLCLLGSWQLQRLAWKTELIAKLDAAYADEANKNLDLRTLENSDFTYGRITGRAHGDKAFLLGVRMQDEKPGADLIVPVTVDTQTLLVNLGFVTGRLEDQPLERLQGKKIDFSGLVRAPSWNRFTPENQPEKNIWYRLDIEQIAAAKNLPSPVPMVLYAERTSTDLGENLPNNRRILPNNNHLQYALFWFAMAGVLIVIFVLRFFVFPARARAV